MNQQPLISAITLNYKNGLQAIKCVRNFQQQTIADQMEVIVVDNYSDNDSIGILRTRLQGEDVRIVETPKNDGFGYGYNTGVHYASGTYILINNPDKMLEPDGIEKLIQKMESDPSIGIIAPKLVHADGTRRLSVRHYPKPLDIIIKRLHWLHSLFGKRLAHYLMLQHDPDEACEADWIVGGLFLMRRDVFKQLGGFDERFFLFFEDTDLCKRCHQLGKTVLYYPDVVARDRKKRLSEGSVWSLLTTRIGRAHVSSAVKYFWKWRVG